MSPAGQQGSRSGAPQQQGFHPGSPGQQAGRAGASPSSYPAPLGYDPGRSQTTSKEPIITNRRVELPSAAYQLGMNVSKYFYSNFFRNMMVLE
jgi:hypothetical protein